MMATRVGPSVGPTRGRGGRRALRLAVSFAVTCAITTAATCAIGLSAALVPAPGAAAAVPVPAADEPGIEDEILQLINASRADAGLPPLQRNPGLDQAADEWTAHMIAGSCHNSRFPICHRKNLSAVAKAAAAPNGVKWWAENVQFAFGGAANSHARLMASPGHRANIMRRTTNLIGIGVGFNSRGFMFVTQEFAESTSPPAASPVSSPCGRVTRTLVPGSRGRQVKALQCALARLDLLPGTQDGRYGKATRAAVMEFQRRNGLTETGKADLATRRALGFG